MGKLADRSRVSSISGRGRRASVAPLKSAARTVSSSSIEEDPTVEFSVPSSYDRYGAIGSPSSTDGNHQDRNLRGSSSFVDGNDNDNHRSLSSQLSGCCYTYQSYGAESMCALYGQDCQSGETPSHDSGDGSCEQAGLSFIGVSFSVNTKNGNPNSYHICDQFPMENIIDRDYNYVMSMDEDGWLVGGGYKTFDYSGKMPYIDSSHTELLRVGSLDPNMGGTTIDQVYTAMSYLYIPPLSIFPEYVKGGGGHNSGDNDGSVPSADVTMIVSIVDTYGYDDSYPEYEQFLNDLFDAMEAVGGGPCMDDHDTDPHVSMARGVKFKSSYHMQQYFYAANLEIAVWQAMYPNGVVIGSGSKAVFPINGGGSKSTIGYGNLYFFFDRANMTKSFQPSRSLTTSEDYYSTLYSSGGANEYYESVTYINFNYGGSHDNDDGDYWEHNPYSWNSQMAKHDMTDGWDLPPNCYQEGETFFGIPLSRKSASVLQSTSTFQEQFDFEYLVDRNFTYIKKFGTNHGWLVGEVLDNGAGSIVDKDTAHIPLFYLGTTNADMGGMSLADMIKIGKLINFGKLYLKPAFIFVDDDGAVKLQFEADPSSAMGYLYDNLCKMIGISWNYNNPSNEKGIYTSCAMHAAGDRASYGCGPSGTNSGGFCPQMTLAYRVGFQSEDHAAAFLARGNNYIDYWRSLYPNGVAVGASKFCSDGGCLGLFLNRFDLYYVFKPDLGGSWVEYNGGTMPPTTSPAPTWRGGCDDIHNHHLDKCVRKKYARSKQAVFWDSLGAIGQFSLLLMGFMAATLSASVFVARAKKRKRRNETYVDFFMRNIGGSGGGSGKTMKLVKKKKKKRVIRRSTLKSVGTDDANGSYAPPVAVTGGSGRSKSKERRSSSSRSRSKSKSARSRSRSKSQARHTDENVTSDALSSSAVPQSSSDQRRQLV